MLAEPPADLLAWVVRLTVTFHQVRVQNLLLSEVWYQTQQGFDLFHLYTQIYCVLTLHHIKTYNCLTAYNYNRLKN